MMMSVWDPRLLLLDLNTTVQTSQVGVMQG